MLKDIEIVFENKDLVGLNIKAEFPKPDIMIKNNFKESITNISKILFEKIRKIS